MFEFVVVMPLIFFLVTGVIEFTLAMADLTALRQGVREGARSAVVAEFGADGGCPINGAAPTSDATTRLVCLAKERTDLDPQRVRVRVAWAGDYRAGAPITVCAAYPLESISGLMGPFVDGRVLRTETQMRLERIDDELTQFSELLPAGQTWDWCGG